MFEDDENYYLFVRTESSLNLRVQYNVIFVVLVLQRTCGYHTFDLKWYKGFKGLYGYYNSKKSPVLWFL